MKNCSISITTRGPTSNTIPLLHHMPPEIYLFISSTSSPTFHLHLLDHPRLLPTCKFDTKQCGSTDKPVLIGGISRPKSSEVMIAAF